MIIFGIFLFKFLVFDLSDEVYDDGDTLLFINKKREVRIKLKDIKNLNFQRSRPPRVTLSIQYETEFGSELTFSPPRSKWMGLGKNEVVEDLIDRIDKTKRQT